ncbi:hypothetical protein MAM1_0258d08833 [Mucor ambiguus]|uniref:Uncharacterized protein n=1 Tax=Mucor ambiguus TaxID=91626 RepID=A0A0C9N412_9FUNG|nr:hypothetical protein MAM1_0258d08833 [Mucor ambiguus]
MERWDQFPTIDILRSCIIAYLFVGLIVSFLEFVAGLTFREKELPEIRVAIYAISECLVIQITIIKCHLALQNHEDSISHAMDDDVALEMTAKMVKAGVDTKTSPSNSAKKKQKKQVKSKCRLRRFYA